MRIEQIGGATLYLGDCLEILPTLPKVDAVVTDPPYGIGWRPRVNHQDSPWEDSEVDILACMVASTHCFWGGNYYADRLPKSESWRIWLKRPAGFDDDPRTYSPCEMAWTDYGGKPRIKTHVWDGGMRQGRPENRTFCHPAQKPVEVMEWCIPIDAQTILDPFMGSGTTGVACANLGRKFIGIEIEPKYFEIACERIEAAYAQGRLFDDPEPQPEVQELIA